MWTGTENQGSLFNGSEFLRFWQPIRKCFDSLFHQFQMLLVSQIPGFRHFGPELLVTHELVASEADPGPLHLVFQNSGWLWQRHPAIVRFESEFSQMVSNLRELVVVPWQSPACFSSWYYNVAQCKEFLFLLRRQTIIKLPI